MLWLTRSTPDPGSVLNKLTAPYDCPRCNYGVIVYNMKSSREKLDWTVWHALEFLWSVITKEEHTIQFGSNTFRIKLLHTQKVNQSSASSTALWTRAKTTKKGGWGNPQLRPAIPQWRCHQSSALLFFRTDDHDPAVVVARSGSSLFVEQNVPELEPVKTKKKEGMGGKRRDGRGLGYQLCSSKKSSREEEKKEIFKITVTTFSFTK